MWIVKSQENGNFIILDPDGGYFLSHQYRSTVEALCRRLNIEQAESTDGKMVENDVERAQIHRIKQERFLNHG